MHFKLTIIQSKWGSDAEENIFHDILNFYNFIIIKGCCSLTNYMLQNWKLDKDRSISNTKLIFFCIRLYLYILMYYLYIFCNCIWLMRMSVNDEILTNYGYARQTMIKDVLGEHPQKIFNECFWMPGKLWVILYQLDCVLLKKTCTLIIRQASSNCLIL